MSLSGPTHHPTARGPLAPLLAAALCLTAGHLASAQPAESPREPVVQPVAGTDGRWQVEIRNPRFNRVDDARIAPFLGRDDVLWLRANTHTFLTGLDFVDGSIEFDVAPMDRTHFIAIMFRREAYDRQENIYLRPFKSGNFDAIQYAPRINGSTWQIYPEFSVAAELPRNQWTHVRLEVRGERMEMYLDRAEEPALVIPRLRADARSGSVGFWARVNFDNDAWSAAISNLEIGPPRSAASPPPPVEFPAGVVSAWEIAGPTEAADGPVLELPDATEWRRIDVEETGLANLNRHLGRAGRGRYTAFARRHLVAEAAGTVALQIGYSDDVTVFLNGQPLYSGTNGWESRYPGYLGYMKLGNDTVHLPLRQGRNELVLAVTDDQRFGWGFAAELPTSEGGPTLEELR